MTLLLFGVCSVLLLIWVISVVDDDDNNIR